MHEPQGATASRLRQRKFALLRRFAIPAELLPGSLSLSSTRCGKSGCHCREGAGHPVWSLTFMVEGQKRVERIPAALVEEVRPRVEAGRQFQQAVREVLAINAQLLALAKKQARQKKRDKQQLEQQRNKKSPSR